MAGGIGVGLMLVAGVVHPSDVGEAATSLWRALATVASIMVLTAAARRLGVLDRLAALALTRQATSPERQFALVFLLSAVTSAVLNNDAAVLLLTPLVVLHVRDLYEDPRMQPTFAFAVFMAAGVAPLVVSNPMNFIVAQFVGIGFNTYAARMLPISVAGWIVAYLVLYWICRSELRQGASSLNDRVQQPVRWQRPQLRALAVLLVVLVAYPVASLFDQPIWLVAVSGAALALWVCWRHAAGAPLDVLRKEVSWDTLGFLLGVLVLALGLRNVGFVDHLADLYEGTGVWVVGSVAAVGSAIINNHPMALINLLAIGETHSATQKAYLAALIGGDLGPRLLPIGSLAGLLWYASLRMLGVSVPVVRFVKVGALVTVPSLAVSLMILAAL